MAVQKRGKLREWTEGRVQESLFRYGVYRGWRIMIPNNSTITGWEADMLAVTPAGRLHEFEIKVDVGDLRAELFAARAARGDVDAIARGPSSHKVYKHQALAGTLPEHARWRRHVSPTYFWLVVPERMRSDARIEPPSYAGVMFVSELDRAIVDVEAPRLSSGGKLGAEHYQSLAAGLSARYWETRIRS